MFVFSSELEEVYEQFSRWLDDPILETDKGTKKQLDGRDLAVVRFAGSLLKRTLSESFAGVPVPLTEGCEHPPECGDGEFSSNKKNKLVLNAKSLSLELARHKHRLAAQLVSELKSYIWDCPTFLFYCNRVLQYNTGFKSIVILLFLVFGTVLWWIPLTLRFFFNP